MSTSEDDSHHALMSEAISPILTLPNLPNSIEFNQLSRWEKLKSRFHYFYDTYVLANSGISLLVLCQVLNSIMVTTCKLLLNDKTNPVQFDPLQVLFFRMFITYICCLLYMYITKSVADAPFGPPNLRFYLALRGILGFVGVYGLYFSLLYLSVLDAVAITFLVPMVTGLVAWIGVREQYSLFEAGCTLISLGGVLLIAKPSFLFGTYANESVGGNEDAESSSPAKRLLATILGLIGVFGASLVYVLLRIVKSAHPLISVSYFALTCVIVSSISIAVLPNLLFIIPTSTYQWSLFMLIGFSGFFMQFCLAAGVLRVKASLASLMTYLNFVFALFWDLIIWGHIPGLLSFIGIVIIISMAGIAVKYRSNVMSDPPLTRQPDLENDPKVDEVELLDFEITDEHSEIDDTPNGRLH